MTLNKQALRELIREAGNRKIIVPAKTVAALLDELEAAEKRIAEFELREHTVTRQRVIDSLSTVGGSVHEIEEYMKRWDAENTRETAAAGIKIKGE